MTPSALEVVVTPRPLLPALTALSPLRALHCAPTALPLPCAQMKALASTLLARAEVLAKAAEKERLEKEKDKQAVRALLAQG